MVDAPNSSDSPGVAVNGLLRVLLRDCPALGVSDALIRRLAQQIPGAESGSDDAAADAQTPLSLQQALSVVAAGQNLLASGVVAGVGDATAASLPDTLDALASELGAALRREQAHRVRGLYVIVDPEVTGGRDPIDVAAAAVRGGARMLQLRDKLRDKGESLPLARDLQALCAANDALLIVNDHLDLAVAVGSGGAHVGQTDLPVDEARRVLAPQQVLGRSNREFDQLAQSQEMGADHLAFGPIYQTVTKSIVRRPQGPERLKRAREIARLPLVAIGGINAENVGPVVDAGADAICVTAAVGAAPDPEAAANRLVEAIHRAGGKT